jgi:hypothetical protein
MSVSWYLKRLQSMSGPELTHRVVELVKKKTAPARLEGWHRYRAEPVRSPFAALATVLGADATPDLTSRILRAADMAAAGRFSALGRDWPAASGADTPLSGVWTLDPVTGGHWPGADRFCFSIPYRHERVLGDVKYVWELNRLQQLQPLGAAALLTGEDRYVLAAERIVTSWHKHNPPFRGLGWASGIEVALRAISILVLLGLIGDRISDKVHTLAGEILTASLFWLDRFPSRFSSANNHKVAEEAALYLLCLALPRTPARKRILRHAAEGLEREALLQILPDGSPAEQSPTYGAFTAEFLLICVQLGEDGPRPLSPEVLARLRRLGSFITDLSGSGRVCPRIGDDDEGRVLTLTLPEPEYALNMADLLTEARWSRPPQELRDMLWSVPPETPDARSGPVISYPDGGYTLLRGRCAGREVEVVFDHGPLGYLSIAAHGHADALSVLLGIDGRPVLVDPGTFLYHSGGDWRDWFRSTRAHNTLTISGADQSLISGTFNWSSKAEARLVRADTRPFPSATALHEGYGARYRVSHQRNVAIREGELRISDRLIPLTPTEPGSPVTLPVELAFQLPPELRAERSSDGHVLISAGDTPIAHLILPEGGDTLIRCGGDGFDGGWVSPRFGVRVPAPRISWTGICAQEPFVTRVVPC